MKHPEKFKALGLSDNTLAALSKKGFEEPSPIQAMTIPLLLNGTKDIVAQAQTGTGKTAAFGLPIIELIPEKTGRIQALIITPTRELAIQVSEEINSLKGKKKIFALPVYGGQAFSQQLQWMKKGVDIVVGTPGRLLDHLRRKSMRLDDVSFLVLDEADEMLNMGFIEDVESIMKQTGPNRRVLLFSATMPREIVRIAEKYMGEYDKVIDKNAQMTVSLTDQIYFEVSASDKFEALSRIIDIEEAFYGLIFCRTKVDVDTIASRLMDRGYNADGLHGDLSQAQREKILKSFRNKRINVLVATDVAARGIDIQNLTHVINYAIPQNPEAYVHRIGRTGRAGQEGTAITFITPMEYRKLMVIKKLAKTDIRKETVPKVREIIRAKRARIRSEINEVILADSYEDYIRLSQQILEDHEPEKALAALLKHAFQDELDKDNYNEIRDVLPKIQGKTRLFVGMGKKDNINAKQLVQMIEREANVKSERIKDVQIMESFSFVTANLTDAEVILQAFKKINRGKRPLIVKAKNPDSKPGRDKPKKFDSRPGKEKPKNKKKKWK